jgi:hypothetical protein
MAAGKGGGLMALSLTFIMCEFGHPNFLAHGLDGIVRNCPTRPRVIVPFSDPTKFYERDGRNWPGARDFFINQQTGEKEPKFRSIYDYIEKHGDWARENNIEFYDLTKLCLHLRRVAEERGTKYKGGHDCAIKNNWAAGMVTSEIIVPNYDADFYPSYGYDVALLELVKANNKPKSTWIATHVQPRVESEPGIFAPSRVEATRAYHCSHLGWPVASDILTPQDWNRFCQWMKSDRLIVEPCGERRNAHWNPQALRTEDFLGMGGFPVGLGMDPNFDAMLGEAGFTKYSTYQAFTLHKAWMRGPLLAEAQ